MDQAKWFAATGLLALVFAANGCAQSAPQRASVVKQQPDAASAAPTFESGSRKYRECVATAGDDSQARGRCLDGELAYRQRRLDELYQEWAAKFDSTRRGALHAEHRTWQQETDRLCGPAAGAQPVDQVCRLDRIMARFEVLNYRLLVRTGAPSELWAEEMMPDANGRLEMRLGDAVITMQSDGCTTNRIKILVCSNARLSVSTPTLHRQTLVLPEIWISEPGQSTATGIRGSLFAGYAHGQYGITLPDINADGYEDLVVWSGAGGSYGDPSYTYYLYDPKTRRLVENTALAKMMESHSLSRIVDGRMLVWYRSGPCDNGAKWIEVRDSTPRIAERMDYSTCGKDAPPWEQLDEFSKMRKTP